MGKKDKELEEEQEEQKKKPKKRIKISTNGISTVSDTIFGTLKEIVTHKKQINSKNEIMRDFYEYYESASKKHSAYTKRERYSFLFLALIITHIIILIVRYYIAITYLKSAVITNNILYLIAAAILPYIAWLYATDENFWAFHKRKRMFFYICSINLALTLIQPLYSLSYKLAAKICLLIPLTPLTGLAMIVTTAQVIILLLLALFVFILYNQIEPLITSQTLKRQIEIFKFKHIKDERTDIDAKYDLHIIKELESGEAVVLKEGDRFVQTEVNGASGTGKTSSIFTTAIEEDLNTKLRNREKRQEEILHLIRNGKATIKGPLREFKESAVIPIGKTKAILDKNSKELEKIRKRYPDAGITVIAPNASLNEDIIRLAQARRVMVNVIDPVNDYSHYENVRTVSMNPFYIPFGLTENERLIHITQASSMFAEVLIATNQMSGDIDPYFKDIALTVCSNVATVIMLFKNIKGEQAYIEDIQEAINDFKKLDEYVQFIEEHYKITIDAKEIKEKKSIQLGAEEFQRKNNTQLGEQKKQESIKAKANPYYLQILFVKQELLGAGAEDMFSQSRGLRNLINKVIVDPRIRAKLSAQDEYTMLNFDELLAENQITIVNTAIELGASTSTAFGLFFILLHKISVLRRPIDTRTPHFLWIDEATQYMHPCYEDMIALYRQFKCAVTISLQSLNQTEKSRSTAYLKEVFLGAGTHIVFGRLTPEEQKIYSEMGGIVREVDEQITYTSSSLVSSTPSSSESTRRTNVMTNVVEGSDMRLRDFQELTVFTIDNGRVLPAIIARVFFVKPEAFDLKVGRSIIWERLVPEAFQQNMGYKPNKEAEKMEEEFEKPLLTITDDIPEDETETIVTQKQVDVAIEDKNKYDDMSLEEMLRMISGDTEMPKEETTEDNPSEEMAETKKPKQPTRAETDQLNYKKMLDEFNRK